eukprot:CAMPEP_0119015402 /NCGR_PEP_ID=MMETSP1176-20130426/10963_1 /TAXON_ID=265551 /ORGANISM="Synedropsis recta cf, Strain CCMP1620" /LENGTH=107 /DNA_ID=CAMNT_0006968693 /DNA_START=89 /DNA_END=412 /DNA_ORIENTATION=+
MSDATPQLPKQGATIGKQGDTKGASGGEKRPSLTLLNLFGNGTAPPPSLEDSLSYSASSFLHNSVSNDSSVFLNLKESLNSENDEGDTLLDTLEQAAKELEPIQERG